MPTPSPTPAKTQTLAYVSDGGSAGLFPGQVEVLNTQTGAVVTTIPIAPGIAGIAISPDGSRAYVANNASNAVAVIDTKRNAIINTINVGAGPQAVAVSPDGKLVYVTNLEANSVSVIDTLSSLVVKTIPVGVRPFALSFSNDGAGVYVADAGDVNGSESISVIDVASGEVIKTLTTTGSPVGVAASPSAPFVYVVEQGFGLAIVSTDTNEITDQIGFGVGLQGGIAVSPDGRFVYVTDFGQHDLGPAPGPDVPAAVFVVDATSRSVTAAPQTLPGLDLIALSKDGRTAFITSVSQLVTGIVTFDVQSLTFSSTVAHPAVNPNGIALLTTP
jgi:YVTN family beta-propeller protein